MQRLRRRLRLAGAAATAACCSVLYGAPDAAAQDLVPVRGRVLEAGAGVPVGGATIVVRGQTGGGSVTAADGTWLLLLPAGLHDLTVQHLSYAGADVRVSAGDTTGVTVRLTPRPMSLDQLVVTASRRPQQLKDVPVATEVVGRREIERSGASDLSAVLVERTGITAEGGHPVGEGLMLQGLSSERVLVLVDGQPFIGRISGGLDLSRIPAAMIERVEVVKGPQSTLYGSEAMGGVVNVITRAPEPGSVWAGRLGVTGGSHDRLDVAGNALGSIGTAAFAVDAGRRTIELVPGHAGDAGTFATRWDGGARVQWQAAPSLSWHAGVLLLDESQRWKSGALYNFTDNVQWGGRVGAAYTRGGHRLTPAVYATEFRHLSRRSTLPQPTDAASDETEVQRLAEAELLYGYAADRFALEAGVEARRESIHSDRVAGEDRVLHTVEPFAQATASGDAWSVVPGMRLSWSEQWGAHFTPRLAAMLRPTEQLALRASVGRGFRAPSFKELYMEFLNASAGSGYRVQGNPELQPETSFNVGASGEWNGERIYSRVQLFYNRFDNFIEARQASSDGGLTLYVYGNVDDGETYGAEFELGTSWRGLQAEAGYGWLAAYDRATGEVLLGRPAHSARASLTYALPFGLRSSMSATRIGATPVSRTDDAAIVNRDALTRLDLRIAQNLPRGLELAAGLDNVFDATSDGYSGHLGRQLYLSIDWSQ